MDPFDPPAAPIGADLLAPEDVAHELGIAPATLAAWRSRGTGPTFVKLGDRLVRYRRADLSAYIAARRRNPAEAGA